MTTTTTTTTTMTMTITMMMMMMTTTTTTTTMMMMMITVDVILNKNYFKIIIINKEENIQQILTIHKRKTMVNIAETRYGLEKT